MSVVIGIVIERTRLLGTEERNLSENKSEVCCARELSSEGGIAFSLRDKSMKRS